MIQNVQVSNAAGSPWGGEIANSNRFGSIGLRLEARAVGVSRLAWHLAVETWREPSSFKFIVPDTLKTSSYRCAGKHTTHRASHTDTQEC